MKTHKQYFFVSGIQNEKIVFKTIIGWSYDDALLQCKKEQIEKPRIITVKENKNNDRSNVWNFIVYYTYVTRSRKSPFTWRSNFDCIRYCTEKSRIIDSRYMWNRTTRMGYINLHGMAEVR